MLKLIIFKQLQTCITFMIDIGDENWTAISMQNTLQNGKLFFFLSLFSFLGDDLWVVNEQQGSRLKADYEVSWDKDGFFQNSRNQTQEKNNMVSTIAADHYRSEAPRRQAYNTRHSPDKVRPRRFKVGFWYLKGLSYCPKYIFSYILLFTSWTVCL